MEFYVVDPKEIAYTEWADKLKAFFTQGSARNIDLHRCTPIASVSQMSVKAVLLTSCRQSL